MDAADNGAAGQAGRVAVGRAAEGVGEYLRARRLQLGLSHADIANVVKLPARRIDALENERWDELPDGPFLRGFLRNVARALDLNATTLMDRVDDSLMRSRNPESILVPPDPPHATLPRRSGPVDDRHGGRMLVYGAFAFALVAALIAWSGTASFDRTLAAGRGLIGSSPTAARPASGTPTAEATTKVATTSEPASPLAPGSEPSTGLSTTPSSPPSTASSNPTTAQPVDQSPTNASANSSASAGSLQFHFNEDSWVEVRAADGRVLLQRLNPAGSEQEVDGEAPFSLIVGNARGVALRFHGRPVDLAPYTRDQVARLTLS